MRVDDVTNAPKSDANAERARAIANIKSSSSDASGSDKSVQTAQAAPSVDETDAKEAADTDRKYRTTKSRGEQVARPKEDDAPVVDQEQLEKAVSTLQAKLKMRNGTEVDFELTSDDPPVLIVRDPVTNKELRRIPSEDVSRIIDAMDELKGLMVDSVS